MCKRHNWTQRLNALALALLVTILGLSPMLFTPLTILAQTPSFTPGAGGQGATAIGGVPLFSTLDTPLSPLVLNQLRLCENEATDPGEPWKLSTTSITLGAPSTGLSSVDGLQTTLFVQHCTEGEGVLSVAPPATLLLTAPLSLATLAQPLLPGAVGGDLVASPGELAPVERIERPPAPPVIPIDALEPLMRGVTLTPIESMPEFEPWRPTPQTSLTLITPDGERIPLTPGDQPNTWSYDFPPDSPSGEYTLVIESDGQRTERTVRVQPNERILTRRTANSELARTFEMAPDVALNFMDFRPESDLLLALYRVVADPAALFPEPGAGNIFSGMSTLLAPVSTWIAQTGPDGVLTQPLLEHLPIEPGEKIAGDYVLLACYADDCAPTPTVRLTANNSVRSIEWPAIFSAVFTVGETPPLNLFRMAGPLELAIIDPAQDGSVAVIEEELLFQAAAADPDVGDFNGAGIERVDFNIVDSRGVEVVAESDDQPPYCAFGRDQPCEPWPFAPNDYRWPGGAPITNGLHTLRVTAYTPDGRSASLETTVDIRPPQPAEGVAPSTLQFDSPLAVAVAYFEAINQGVETGDFHPAYGLLSPDYQARKPYADFAGGFATTRWVEVNELELLEMAPDANRARVRAVVTAIDDVNGREKRTVYEIDWRLIRVGDQWRLNSARVRVR